MLNSLFMHQLQARFARVALSPSGPTWGFTGANRLHSATNAGIAERLSAAGAAIGAAGAAARSVARHVERAGAGVSGRLIRGDALPNNGFPDLRIRQRLAGNRQPRRQPPEHRQNEDTWKRRAVIPAHLNYGASRKIAGSPQSSRRERSLVGLLGFGRTPMRWFSSQRGFDIADPQLVKKGGQERTSRITFSA
jgi:hypothetical protein